MQTVGTFCRGWHRLEYLEQIIKGVRLEIKDLVGAGGLHQIIKMTDDERRRLTVVSHNNRTK